MRDSGDAGRFTHGGGSSRWRTGMRGRRHVSVTSNAPNSVGTQKRTTRCIGRVRRRNEEFPKRQIPRSDYSESGGCPTRQDRVELTIPPPAIYRRPGCYCPDCARRRLRLATGTGADWLPARPIRPALNSVLSGRQGPRKRMVRSRRLELPRVLPHSDLNAARLPIPPRPQIAPRRRRRVCNKSAACRQAVSTTKRRAPEPAEDPPGTVFPPGVRCRRRPR